MTTGTVAGRGVPPGAWVAAVLLPPLALHLAGVPPRAFWVGTGLTLLGFVPGVAFALMRLASRGPAPARA